MAGTPPTVTCSADPDASASRTEAMAPSVQPSLRSTKTCMLSPDAVAAVICPTIPSSSTSVTLRPPPGITAASPSITLTAGLGPISGAVARRDEAICDRISIPSLSPRPRCRIAMPSRTPLSAGVSASRNRTCVGSSTPSSVDMPVPE